MKYKKSIILLILAVFIISMSCVCASDAAMASENSTQSLQNSMQTNMKSFDDIQLAINNAGENDTIMLEGTYTGQGHAIIVNKSITIASKDCATLDAAGKSNVFSIKNAEVCLKNLNIINSKSKFKAAVDSSGNLSIVDCKMSKNIVYTPDKNVKYDENEDIDMEPTAGAVCSRGNLEIINTTFTDNYAQIQARDYESGDYYIVNWGGSLYVDGNLTIRKSKITDSVRVTGSTYVEDSAFSSSMISLSGQSTFTNTSFTKIFDLFYITSNLTLMGCSITDINNLVLFAEFDEEKYNQIIIDGCSIKNNLREIDEFDSIYDPEFIVSSYGDITIKNSEFANNDGTATFLEGRLTVENTSFKNNNARQTLYCENARIINSTFTKNLQAITGENITVSNCTFTKNKHRFGSAIRGDDITIENSTFAKNQEATVLVQKSATINNVTYKGETAFNNSLNVINIVKVEVSNITVVYGSGKNLDIKVTFASDGKPVKDYCLKIRIIKGEETTPKYCFTNSKGIASIKASALSVGSYKIEISSKYDSYTYSACAIPKITTTVKVTKAKTIIKAPKVTNKYKKSEYFKLTVKNKATNKPVKNTYVKIKIDKKTYKIKTNSKGVAKYNTKKLKTGKHKVTITSGNSNYQMSGKSTITIKK
jgi:hypothetical protein